MKHIFTLGLLLYVFLGSAQTGLLRHKSDILSVNYSQDVGSPSQVILQPASPLRRNDDKQVIAQIFDISEDQLVRKTTTVLYGQLTIIRYKRYINGIRVAHGNYTILKDDGGISTVYAEHYDQSSINNTQHLTSEDALANVLPLLGSEKYAWESTAELLDQHDPSSVMYQKLQAVLDQEYPIGEEVYVKDYESHSPALQRAYLYTIESVVPEFRDRVYVSADDGRVLLRDPQLKHGIGDTRYSGRRDFPTTEVTTDGNTVYELKGTEPLSGVYCETRSLEGLGGTPVSTPAIVALSDSIADGDEIDPCLTDGTVTAEELADDDWDTDEHRKIPFSTETGSCCPAYVLESCDEVRNDDIALDAHWGAAMVARYWKAIHNRFGYDDEGATIQSFVHHGHSFENATWNGMIMKYGDGAHQDGNNPGGMFGPLVSLDVCAHEIGHAICTSTSDLVYVGESGAMNEGLSDIWGAAIERYVLDSIDGSLDYVLWSIGEQIDERDGGAFNDPNARAVRWMDYPPAENNPDTYGAGTWWQDPDCASPNVANDFCGIHFNSGVLNKWFYLLSEGSGQPYSPGLNKPAMDDEVNDKGDTYSVTGIGVDKSERIVYGAELLLNPNSKFADMRDATIDMARSLYGPCSNEAEQTIRAWYGVGVGPDYGTCLPTIEFNLFNPREVIETSIQTDCGASKEVTLSIFSYMATETVTFTTSGTAVENEDFELCDTSIDFAGDEEKTLKILIYDDKVEEENDTLIITLHGGVYSDSDTIIIINDDGVPAIGGLDTLLLETFDVNNNSWQQELVNPNSLLNEWYIDPFNTDQAHISYVPTTNVPSYSHFVESHVRLKSPQINAIGRKNVEVSFDYQVGGERDLVDTTALFDFGTFEVSYDGFIWEKIDDFVGNAMSGGTVPNSGLYTVSLPQLDNTSFYLSYTWHNDALNGSAYSFMIDNVLVTGEGLEIESDIGATMESHVPEGARVAFISDTDSEVIAIIEDTKDDLNCTQMNILDNSTTEDFTSSICEHRSSKVFQITSAQSSDSIEVKLYFTESEIDDWADFSTLNILLVAGTDIDDATAAYHIIDNADVILEDHTDGGNGYVTYRFWMSSEYETIALTDRPALPRDLTVMNVSDSGPLSLRALVDQACPSDTIRFDATIDMNIIDLSSGAVTIDKEIYIIGNGVSETQVRTTTHDIFHITTTGELSLEQMTLEAYDPHISILNQGSLNIYETVDLRE